MSLSGAGTDRPRPGASGGSVLAARPGTTDLRLRSELLAGPLHRSCCRRTEAVALREGLAFVDPPTRRWTLRRLQRLGSGSERGGADRGDAARAICDAAARWRGALIVSGHVGSLDGEPTLAVTGPTGGYARSLVSAASRLRVEVRTVPTPAGAVVVVVTTGAGVARVLRATGAPELVAMSAAQIAPGVHRRDGPLERGAQRAASVDRARNDLDRLAELAEPVPAEFVEAAAVRLTHPDATMTELAVIAGLKAHVLAGRLRRLHVLAEHRQEYPRFMRPTPPTDESHPRPRRSGGTIVRRRSPGVIP